METIPISANRSISPFNSNHITLRALDGFFRNCPFFLMMRLHNIHVTHTHTKYFDRFMIFDARRNRNLSIFFSFYPIYFWMNVNKILKIFS